MTGGEAPVTIEIEGREEPIEAVKVAFGKHGNDILAHIVTADGRIATVPKDRLLVWWNNCPTEEDMANMDRLIREGAELAQGGADRYRGVEAQ